MADYGRSKVLWQKNKWMITDHTGGALDSPTLEIQGPRFFAYAMFTLPNTDPLLDIPGEGAAAGWAQAADKLPRYVVAGLREVSQRLLTLWQMRRQGPGFGHPQTAAYQAGGYYGDVTETLPGQTDWTAEANALLDKLVAMFAASPVHMYVLQTERPQFVQAFVAKLDGGWVPKSGYLTIMPSAPPSGPAVPVPSVSLDAAQAKDLMLALYDQYRAQAA
jgi:hypothetical protein